MQKGNGVNGMQYTVALVQGIYFLVTGIWPLLSMRSFLAITGPKTDLWLVKTVGLILGVIGAVLIYAQATATVNPPVVALAIGAAASLALIEIVYVIKRVISPIYLGDAAAELILIAWWAIALLVA
jgi:hypothetical protein